MAVNHVPMTPLTLLQRTVRVFPSRIATVYEGQRVDYAEFYRRVCRLANGLRQFCLSAEGRVAVLAPNVPMVLEAHFGVPLAGHLDNSLLKQARDLFKAHHIVERIIEGSKIGIDLFREISG